MFLGQIYSFLKQILQLPHFFFPQKLRISGSHKSTLSCYRMKQPCMFQFVVGSLCCNNADTQFPGEYADGRQRIALFGGTALLTAIGYVTSSTNAIVPQSMHTQKGIFAMFTIIPGLLGIIGIIPLFFYDLVGEKQKKILKELAERREKAEKREEEKIVEADTQA